MRALLRLDARYPPSRKAITGKTRNGKALLEAFGSTDRVRALDCNCGRPTDSCLAKITLVGESIFTAATGNGVICNNTKSAVIATGTQIQADLKNGSGAGEGAMGGWVFSSEASCVKRRRKVHMQKASPSKPKNTVEEIAQKALCMKMPQKADARTSEVIRRFPHRTRRSFMDCPLSGSASHRACRERNRQTRHRP